jgi:hypothetical protein
MVSFVCDQCQQVLKKPKLKTHRCNSSFTCIDCSLQFSKQNTHTQCITEEQKFQKHIHGNSNQKNVTSNENIARELKQPLIAQIQAKSGDTKAETLFSDTTKDEKKRKHDQDQDARKTVRKALKKPITIKDLYKKLKAKKLQHTKISLKDDKFVIH